MKSAQQRIFKQAGFGIAAGLLGIPTLGNAEQAKPNVIVILADDLGYGDVGCYGATKIKTPNIDRLAREGRKFINAYAPGSVCSPTRYGLLSGRYVWREPRHHPAGVHAPGAPLLFDQDRLTLARLFQQNGYATAAIGKWHQGFGSGDKPSVRYDWSQDEIKPGPLETGFDYFFGMAANAGNHPRIFIENHRFVGRKPGDKVTMLNRFEIEPWSSEAEYKFDQVAGELTKKAVEFIRQSKEKPFFLYFASNIAHNDITPAKEFIGMSGCGLYGDFVQELDSNVGSLLDALTTAGILENTVILFTSDNGGVVVELKASDRIKERLTPQYDAHLAGHLICGDLRGSKHSVYEGGFRVPFIVRWPEQVPSGTQSDELICLTDVLATFASMLGTPLPPNAGEDSFNALPVWKGIPNASVRDSIVLDSSQGVFAVRKGQWKLIEYTKPPFENKKSDPENKNQLYNLADDPAETVNLWDSHPEVVKELTGLLNQVKEKGSKVEQ